MLGAICSSCNKRQAEGTNKKLELNKQKTHFSRMLMLRKKKNLMFVWVKDDSSIFAFSAASVNRCRACLSFSKSIPSSFLKFPASQSTILWKHIWHYKDMHFAEALSYHIHSNHLRLLLNLWLQFYRKENYQIKFKVLPEYVVLITSLTSPNLIYLQIVDSKIND
jgi:hypothetical protein